MSSMSAWPLRLRDGFVARWSALSDLGRDAFLYGLSAVFALGMGLTSSQGAQSRWGYLVAVPYALAALVTLGLLRRGRGNGARLVLLSLVIFGAVMVPLGLEARWRHDAAVGSFAQPEVTVIERSGAFLAQGEDPYRSYWHNGRLVDEVKNEPAFESFFPYFPLMGVFGLPSAVTHRSNGLTDARIVMSLVTLLTSGLALGLLRLTRGQKIRIAQFLIALPTGALFLATGGDDMPILALLLLGVAGLQRRKAALTGLSVGVAAAMKLTAWPMAIGALLVSRDQQGRSTWRTVAAWMGALVTVTVLPFIIKDPTSFIANVVAFPLGLAHVASPAASALPGHILASWWPPLGHVLSPLAFLAIGYFGARDVRAHWPMTLHRLLGLLAVATLVVMCAASATRFGYIIYPLNFWLWSSSCREVVETPVVVELVA